MKEQLLLHCCCGPCAAYPFSVLTNDFRVEAFFSNSNLDTASEYFNRLESLRLLCSRQGIPCYADDYEPETWHKEIVGLENEPERGKRCHVCFEYRLKRTFELAERNKIKYVATTLTVAPYKNACTIFDIANKLSKVYNVKFLELDFKKNDGYIKTKKLAQQNGLYIQNYCGCEFSLLDKGRRVGATL